MAVSLMWQYIFQNIIEKEKNCMIFVVFLYYLDQPPNRTKESIFWNNKKHLLGCHFYKFRTNALARTTPRRSEVNGD